MLFTKWRRRERTQKGSAECIIMRSDINDVIYGLKRKKLYCLDLVAFDEQQRERKRRRQCTVLIGFQGGWLVINGETRETKQNGAE